MPAQLVLVPGLPLRRREGLAVDADDIPDRQPVLQREREIALVVRRHAHHRAVAVTDQHVVAHPDVDLVAGQRMRNRKSRGHALLFHRREIGFHHRAALALFDERGERGVRRRRVRRQRVFGGDGAEGDAHDGVGAGREHVHPAAADQRARGVANPVREGEAHALALADPVGLHRLHALGPAVHPVQLREQFLGVIGDLEVVAGDLALLDQRAGAPAAPVDHLLVGEHRPVDRVPIDDLGLAVGDALLEHLQEQPLVPLVIVRVAGGDFARPVDGEPHRLHLLLHGRDVVVGPLRRRDPVLHRRVLGRQPERVPAHRHQHVVALHPQLPIHDVVDRVVAHVPHVQLARRVGQHRHAVILALRKAGIVFPGDVGVGCFPVALGSGFDGGGIERLHGVVWAAEAIPAPRSGWRKRMIIPATNLSFGPAAVTRPQACPRRSRRRRVPRTAPQRRCALP